MISTLEIRCIHGLSWTLVGSWPTGTPTELNGTTVDKIWVRQGSSRKSCWYNSSGGGEPHQCIAAKPLHPLKPGLAAESMMKLIQTMSLIGLGASFGVIPA